MIRALLGNDHRPIIEIANALTLLFAPLQKLDCQALARKHDRLHRIGQIVEVDHFDSLQPRDLVEIVVVGDDLPPEVLRQHHQTLVNLANPRQFGDLGIVNPDLDARRLLQAIQNIEPSAPAVSPQLV
jgi:hypothetical protein